MRRDWSSRNAPGVPSIYETRLAQGVSCIRSGSPSLCGFTQIAIGSETPVNSPLNEYGLYPQSERRACTSWTDRAPGGLAACSLHGGHRTSTHQLLCEETGEVLGEWSDSDLTFREHCSSTETCCVQLELEDQHTFDMAA